MTPQDNGSKKMHRAKHFAGCWDEKSFFAEMEKRHGIEFAEISRALYDWADNNVSEIHWGNGKAMRDATFYAKILGGMNTISMFGVETRDQGFLFLRLTNIMSIPPFVDEKKRKKLLGRLQAIINIPVSGKLDHFGIPLTEFSDNRVLDDFCQFMMEILKEIRS